MDLDCRVFIYKGRKVCHLLILEAAGATRCFKRAASDLMRPHCAGRLPGEIAAGVPGAACPGRALASQRPAWERLSDSLAAGGVAATALEEQR